MSRMTAALLLASAPASAAAEVTAEQALAKYRQVFKSPQELDCPTGGDEIVVCAPRRGAPSPFRLPLGVQRQPGERVRGEASADFGGCVSRCHQPVQVNILAIPGFIGRAVGRLRDD